MYFKQFLDERCGCASYLIASRQTREAAIIDPGLNLEQYEAVIALRDFTLKYVIDTHVHADHISGARKLADLHHPRARPLPDAPNKAVDRRLAVFSTTN